MKRLMDIAFSVLLMVFLLPVFVFVSVLIKTTSSGPIIFSQKRIGRYGKEFNIYKFRTMYQNSPANTPTHLLKNPENHITPIGRVLRKSSLDELPQLINILLGEMSFVGPRPALYNQYDLISKRENNGIHKVCPGITGWAQVNGRDRLSIEEKILNDKFYVENQSLYLDLKIVLKTVVDVFLTKGIVEGAKIDI